MITDVAKTIEKYDMLHGKKTVTVGVSGGADSVCLIHILSRFMEKYDIVLNAVHVNHNIRANEANRDEEFVKQFCKSLGIKCTVFNIDVPKLAKEMMISAEECGRIVRYDCFNKTKADVIAVAHTLSDSIETVLFNLARGTGLKGVCGIPPKRDNIIRPLIEVTRQQVEAYCKENGLAYVTDSTNLSDDYTRNKIRHQVVPALININPNFESTVLRFMQNTTLENDFLQKESQRLLLTSATSEGYSILAFNKVHPAIVKRSVAMIIEQGLNKPVESRHINLCVKAIENKQGKIELAKGIYFCVDNNRIYLKKLSVNSQNIESKQWKSILKDGKCYCEGGNFKITLKSIDEINKNDYNNSIAAETVQGDLFFRSRSNGDKFTDYRRKNTKTLKKLFTEKKIPLDEREKIAILCDSNDILWIDRFGVNAKHRITEKTKFAYIIIKLNKH